MKVVAIVQARMGSTRLPGKVLMEAVGVPLIVHMLKRVNRCQTLDKVWLATSINPENNPLQSCAEKEGFSVFRGSEDDVLSRYWEIAQKENPDLIVRLTGDCPLHDPQLIDSMVQYMESNLHQYDYVANSLLPTYPDGLDVEIFTMKSLDDAYHQAISPIQREHVTPYIHRFHDGPGPYRVGHYQGIADFSHLRWTVDEPEDYEFVRKVFEHLYPEKPDFGWLDVVALITKHPELMFINGHFERNASYFKALDSLKK